MGRVLDKGTKVVTRRPNEVRCKNRSKVGRSHEVFIWEGSDSSNECDKVLGQHLIGQWQHVQHIGELLHAHCRIGDADGRNEAIVQFKRAKGFRKLTQVLLHKAAHRVRVLYFGQINVLSLVYPLLHFLYLCVVARFAKQTFLPQHLFWIEVLNAFFEHDWNPCGASPDHIYQRSPKDLAGPASSESLQPIGHVSRFKRSSLGENVASAPTTDKKW